MTSATASDGDFAAESRGHRRSVIEDGQEARAHGARRKSQGSVRGRTGGSRTHDHGPGRHRRNSHSTRATNRSVEARRRKEKIRRRKRLHSRCTVLENLINRLEQQPEVDSRSLVKVTCRDVTYFIILFSVILFIRSAIYQYTKGVLEQLQLGYLFPSGSLDLISGTEKIGFVVTIIFVALFGSRSNKPVLIASGVLVLCLGAIIWPVPYFVTSTQGPLNISYGCDTSMIWISPQPGFDNVEVPPNIYGQLCKRSKYRPNSSSVSYTDSCSTCPTNTAWMSTREGLLHVVYLAGFLMGFGTGLFLTSGILYIEEASMQKNTPIQYGTITFQSLIYIRSLLRPPIE